MSVLGEQKLQKGSECKIHIHCKQCKNNLFVMDSLTAHVHLTLIKLIGCVTCMIDCYAEKHQLPSITSKHSHLIKCIMVLLVLQFNREIRIKKKH